MSPAGLVRSRRVAAIPPEPEEHFQNAVVDLARRLGWLVHHQYDARRSTAGVPDLLLVRPPRIIFAELKRETGRTTNVQVDWLTRLAACPSVEVWVWRPSDKQRIAEVLR